MEKYKYKKDAMGILSEKCMVLNNGAMIGSVACHDCANNTHYNEKDNTITCAKIEEATKKDLPDFRVGDTVYWFDKKGEVKGISAIGQHTINVLINGVMEYFTPLGELEVGQEPTLSFTPWNPVSGGLSQVRPVPEIKVGQLIYVRESGECWEMRYFSHFEDGEVACFVNQKKSIDGQGTQLWPEYSIENPLL